jgi:hypothetical protein
MPVPDRPILSIVIPTRNRAATLSVVVDGLLKWPDEDVELIVEDNSDEEAMCAPIRDRWQGDRRLKWAWDGRVRSAIENCDAAIGRATGEVVCFIGDDDSIARHSLAAARWMVERDVDALLCSPGSYLWPDVENAVSVNDAYNGRLAPLSATGGQTSVHTPSELCEVARCGALSMGKLPRVYQAFVQRRVLERMRASIGTYFPGPVPDMSNAVGMAGFVGKSAFVDIPLTISGQSASSMSGRNARRDHQGAISAERSLPADAGERWDPRVPRYWSGPTIWAQAALEAAKTVNNADFVPHFSFAKVYAACFTFNRREHYPAVWAALRQHGLLQGALIGGKVAGHMVRLAVLRTSVLLPKFFKQGIGTAHQDVASAANEVEAFIDANNLMAFTRISGRKL